MVRRIAISIAAIMFIGAFGQVSAADKDLSSGDIKKLVNSYFDEDTNQPKRIKIIESLKATDPKNLTKRVSKFCKDEEDRPKALQMAIALRIPGLFKSLKKHFDTLDRVGIIDWYLVVRDKDGLKVVLKKWDELSVESSEWETIDEAFRRHRQSSVTLNHFKEKVSDVARGSPALNILRWQLEKPELDEDTVISKWPALKAEFDLVYKAFKIEHYDMITMKGWWGEKTAQAGPNLRVQKAGWWYLNEWPKKINASGLELTIRACHVDGHNGYIGLYQEDDNGLQTGFSVEFKPTGFSYCDPTGKELKSALYKKNTWQVLKWKVWKEKAAYMCSIEVDGKMLLAKGEFQKAPTQISLRSTDVEFLVGGIDMRIG